MTAALFDSEAQFSAFRSDSVRLTLSQNSLKAVGSGVKVARPVTRVRLTRRGRRVLATAIALLVITVVAALAFFLGTMSASSVAASTAQSEGVATTSIVVHAGQNLWQIAQQVNPAADPRATMEQISALNGMGSGVHVQAGQVLLVPVIK